MENDWERGSKELANNQLASLGDASSKNTEYRLAGFNSLEQLQVLYEIRVRENQHLNGVIQELNTKMASQECKHMLAEMSNICDEYKDQHAKYKNEIASLQLDAKLTKTKIEALENSNCKLSEELTLYKTMTTNLQTKLQIVRASSGQSNFIDLMIESLQQKHQQEILSLQQQLHTSHDTIAQKNCDIERYERMVKSYEMEMNEKIVNLEFKQTAKSMIAGLQQKLSETIEKLAHLKLVSEATSKEMVSVTNRLQGAELELAEFKSRDVLFAKLTIAFIQDLKLLSLNALGTVPKEDTSQVAELKRSDLVSYKQLLSYIQMTSETEDPDIQIKVLKKMIHCQREKKNAALDEFSAVRNEMEMEKTVSDA